MLTIAPHIVWQDVPGELALFDAEAQAYHCLDPIASDIWRALARGGSAETIVADLAARFDAPTPQIAADVAAFVDDALAKRLIVATSDV